MSEGEQADALELAIQPLEIEAALGVDPQEVQLGPGLGRQQLPGNQVAVVLHLGQQDAVAPVDVGPAPAVADQVDGLGDVAGEHDLPHAPGVDEAGHLLPGRLVGGGRLLGDLVDASVDVRVVAPVVVVQRRDHRLRLLRGVGAVQVDERMAVDLTLKDGELAADRAHVEGVPVGPHGRHAPCHARVRDVLLDHAGCASFIRSATVTPCRVAVMVLCRRSQKPCAEQGVSA